MMKMGTEISVTVRDEHMRVVVDSFEPSDRTTGSYANGYLAFNRETLEDFFLSEDGTVWAVDPAVDWRTEFTIEVGTWEAPSYGD